MEIWKISRSRSYSSDDAEFSHFTFLFCRGRQRNVQRFIRKCTAIVLLVKSFVWWYSRCCHRSRLFKLFINHLFCDVPFAGSLVVFFKLSIVNGQDLELVEICLDQTGDSCMFCEHGSLNTWETQNSWGSITSFCKLLEQSVFKKCLFELILFNGPLHFKPGIYTFL